MPTEDFAYKRRPRISLLSLLLLTGLIATSITTAMLWREVGPLRAEVRRLRDEVGELSIVDPTRFHAIRVRTANELEWKWRIWIPEGIRYKIRVKGGDGIPKEGYPKSGGTISLDAPGEHLVRYAIEHDPRGGEWRGTLKISGNSVGGSIGSDHHAWVEWGSRTPTGGGVSHTTVSKEPSELVELARLRVAQVNSSSDIPDPAPGFVVWMEPF